MAGGRPENLVVDKLNDAVPIVQTLGEVDAPAAQIVVKSLVHSFFTDSDLRLPIYTINSVQEARMKCSASIVRYDPDGGKAEAYKNVRAEEGKSKRTREETAGRKKGTIRRKEEAGGRS